MSVLLYLLWALIFCAGCVGWVFFSAMLSIRVFDWNDRRRVRAARYRSRR